MSEKLSHQDQLNIGVEERLSKLSVQDKYVLTKKIRSDALVSIGVGIGLGILGLILAETINRAFYGFFIFSLVGIIRGSVDLANPTRAIRLKLSQTIQDGNTNLSKGIELERRKKQKRAAIVWFSILGVFIVIPLIVVPLIMLIASSGE